MSSKPPVSPISKPELEELLNYIEGYRAALAKDNDLTPADIYFGNKAPISKYADFEHAAKIASPLTPFFVALILMDNKPDALKQEHLDIMRQEVNNQRSTAFNELRAEGGERIVDRLINNHLLIAAPEIPQLKKRILGRFFGKAAEKSPAESYPQLNPSFHKLAVTPLQDVKAMLKKIESEGYRGVLAKAARTACAAK